MKNIENIKLRQNATIKEALGIIDSGAMQIALVVDDNDKLLGTLTDGDIRRGILRGLDLDSSIETIVFKEPAIAKISSTKEEILKIALSKKLHQIPIVDDNGIVLDLKEIEELVEPKIKTSRVILMVGGLGTRLRPLTQDTPKPMLKVGNKPILQTIVERFAEYGFVNITMCVNFNASIIRDYFSDGKEFGVNIDYVLEEKRMGTAGALSLLKERPSEPFFVMNGDLLTNVNFEHIFNYHILNKATATMCVREYDYEVPYGVVKMNDNKIIEIAEKPVQKFFVSAGIYMLSPEILDLIPKNEFYDMPALFEKLIKLSKNVISFPIREYWLDIGRMEEYQRANEEYKEVF
ncbi:D-glycero-D-manno-heptose 1-phosphate guanosyltransferase [Campylobacter concisus UNSW1]|jgi:nucleotidyl transferase|uniref:nucleotidyltransferase family protein n=1 Tax=Campylobacter concisus TaxID=199 RepID=UPI000398D98B|nr:nucleotidyltransferase family protein [Campylobacter concisus]ERJ23039.1 D-glycero-D-manno-heptose 1-phosphate guanosyltransferase [Campylobacter concisus UNSW1]